MAVSVKKVDIAFLNDKSPVHNKQLGLSKIALLLWTVCAGVITVTLTIASCSTYPPTPSVGRPHHTADGFRNQYAQRSGGSFWKWKWEQWRNGVPKHPREGYHFPLRRPDLAYLSANRTDTTLTWLGHASLWLQVGGLNIVTDPHLSGRASPLSFAGPRRVVDPPLQVENLPHIDLVLLSHNHYDHLDVATITKLGRQKGGQPAFFVPLGLKRWLASRGMTKVVEMDWWEQQSFEGLTLHFTPMQHWSKRTLWDTNQTLWGGWLVEHPSLRFLFLADTGYSADFKDIFARYGAVDLAAIPVGNYEPRWFMKTQHVNPPESVQIHLDLHAKQSVGIHWGTFADLTDEPVDEPPGRLRTALAERNLREQDFFLMEHGETRVLAHNAGASLGGQEGQNPMGSPQHQLVGDQR